MKKFIYILLLIPGIILSCDKDVISDSQSQQFVKFYTGFPEFSAVDVAVTENGYAIAGTAKTLAGEEDTWICLLRIDKFGNSIDSARIYGKSTGGRAENKAFSIKTLDDGGFGILGSVRNNQTGYRSVYFIRTDSNGDTLFTRTISRNGDVEARHFDVSSDESFYLAGYFNDPLKKHEFWWFGIDKSGNDIRNQRTQGFEYDDECNNLAILPDGGLLICGFRETNTGGIRSFIIRTNENTLFLREFEIPATVDENANCVLPLDNNSCLLLVTSENSSGSVIKLMRIDVTAKNIVWEKSYTSSYPATGIKMMMDDQNIYILGTSMINSTTSLITLLKTDLSGNEIDRIDFGSGSKLMASSFIRTDDGGFIITGTNVHPEVNNTAAALIKTK